MASEKQIAANRRNARKSTGPKSATGKRRSARNRLRYGLSRQLRGNAHTDDLARKLAGEDADEERLEVARTAIWARRELLRIRDVKRDLFQRMYRFGTVRPLRRFPSLAAEIRYVLETQQADIWPEPFNPLGPLPSGEDERAAETMRRLLPEYSKIERYERRAFSAMFRALRELAGRPPE